MIHWNDQDLTAVADCNRLWQGSVECVNVIDFVTPIIDGRKKMAINDSHRNSQQLQHQPTELPTFFHMEGSGLLWPIRGALGPWYSESGNMTTSKARKRTGGGDKAPGTSLGSSPQFAVSKATDRWVTSSRKFVSMPAKAFGLASESNSSEPLGYGTSSSSYRDWTAADGRSWKKEKQ